MIFRSNWANRRFFAQIGLGFFPSHPTPSRVSRMCWVRRQKEEDEEEEEEEDEEDLLKTKAVSRGREFIQR